MATQPLHPSSGPWVQQVCQASAGDAGMHHGGGGRWLLTPFSTDITIKVEDPDCLSSSSYRDVESERFLSSSSSTARRVSFNEAALFDQGKKTQEKGRR